jgi:hypothetical protein
MSHPKALHPTRLPLNHLDISLNPLPNIGTVRFGTGCRFALVPTVPVQSVHHVVFVFQEPSHSQVIPDSFFRLESKLAGFVTSV